MPVGSWSDHIFPVRKGIDDPSPEINGTENSLAGFGNSQLNTGLLQLQTNHQPPVYRYSVYGFQRSAGVDDNFARPDTFVWKKPSPENNPESDYW
jgi:hypothetical protein